MSNRMPSLAALLGLVAIAGYQNRDKIGDFIKNMQHPASPGGGDARSPGRPENPADMTGTGYGGGGSVLGGLGDLIDQFRNAGLGKKADSWVAAGQNEPVGEEEVGKALGPDLLDMLAKQTGLDRAELLKRLSQVLPEAVDNMTPDGRLPPAPRHGAA